MVCKKCGQVNTDNAAFCRNCGEKMDVESINKSQDSLGKTDPNGSSDFMKENGGIYGGGSDSVVISGESSKKKIPLIPIIGIVVVVALIIGIVSLFGDKPEDVAADFCAAIEDYDAEKVADLLAIDVNKLLDDVIAVACEEADMTEKEAFEEIEDLLEEKFDIKAKIKSSSDILKYSKDIVEAGLDELRIDGIELSLKVKGEPEEIDEDDLEDMIDTFDDVLKLADQLGLEEIGLDADDYIDTDKIKEGYTVTVQIAIEFDGDKMKERVDLIIVKYDGDWKVFSIDNLDEIMEEIY